ncbi:MAG: UbiA family prenyltransferase [Planctomycetaceae bacterium]
MSRLRDYLQLCRFPAVFTAMADVFLGYLLVHVSLSPRREFGLLLGASSCLYLAGMVFNDVFDRKIDAAERPNRPIPSGRIPLQRAVSFGTTLMIAGLVLAACAGTNSAAVALLLVACIFAYDGLLKNTPLGPLFMGGCRLLNVILGASSAGLRWTAPWQLPHVFVAAALGIYVAGVTWFARKEAQRSARSGLLGAMLVINLGLGLLLVLSYGVWSRYLSWNSAPEVRTSSLLLLAMVALIINRRALAAVRDPSPALVQAAVKVMLLSIITLDAAVIYAKLGSSGVVLAVATMLLVVPSLAIGRWLYVT